MQAHAPLQVARVVATCKLVALAALVRLEAEMRAGRAESVTRFELVQQVASFDLRVV